MHPFAVDRVKGVQVEDRLDLGTAIGQRVDPRTDLVIERIAVEKDEIA